MTTPADSTRADSSDGKPARRWTLIAVLGATFMLLVDLMVVQVALPTIQREVGGSFTDLQWVIDAYALTLAASILACGSLADRLGRRRVFVIGVGVFTAASLLCGLAGSVELLIAARALQGLGGAAMFATGLALIGQEFRGSERGKAIALWGATIGTASAVGPLLGGSVTDVIGWRWIFLVNIPIGIGTILVARRTVNTGDPGARRLDWKGLVLFSGSLFLLMLSVLRGNDEGWGSTAIVSQLVGSFALMVAFVAVERHQPRPMFDLSLLRKPGFVGVSVATLGIGAGLFAVLPYLTLYLQNGLGYSPLAGGLCLLPATAMCLVVPLATRAWAEKLSPGVILGAALATTAAGLAAMHGLSAGGSWTALIPGLLLAGIGVGLANPAIARTALAVVPPERAGMASGISNTFRIGGLALGVAALGAVFESQLATSLRAQLGQPSAQLVEELAAGGSHAAEKLAPAHPGIVDAAHEAFVASTNHVLLIGFALVTLGALAAFALVRSRHLHGPTVAVAPRHADPVPEPARP